MIFGSMLPGAYPPEREGRARARVLTQATRRLVPRTVNDGAKFGTGIPYRYREISTESG